MGTCSGDGIGCVSGVTVHEGLEGESALWVGWGAGRWPGASMSTHAPLTEDGELDHTERACDTLLMCIVTVMNHGLRNGGGVGDILRKPSKDVSPTRPTPDPTGLSPGGVGSRELPTCRTQPDSAAWPFSLQCLKPPFGPSFLCLSTPSIELHCWAVLTPVCRHPAS